MDGSQVAHQLTMGSGCSNRHIVCDQVIRCAATECVIRVQQLPPGDQGAATLTTPSSSWTVKDAVHHVHNTLQAGRDAVRVEETGLQFTRRGPPGPYRLHQCRREDKQQDHQPPETIEARTQPAGLELVLAEPIRLALMLQQRPQTPSETPCNIP
jgi:hypothetical protein